MSAIGRLISKTVLTGAAAFGAYWYVQKVWAYRDPDRVPDRTGRTVISPSDGIVMYIKQVKNGSVLSPAGVESIPLSDITKSGKSKANGWLIGIYMSPFDVRYNYSPIKGKITALKHFGEGENGQVLNVPQMLETVLLRHRQDIFHKTTHFSNERNTFEIKGKDLEAKVVQISDVEPDSIKPLSYEGENVEVGQRIGFMDQGSHVDLFIAKAKLEIQVDVGDQVYGAQTVIAQY